MRPPGRGPLVIRGLRRIARMPGRLYERYWLRRRGSFVVSYPKAGRTWLAVMLASVLADLTTRPVTLDVHRYGDPARGIPWIFFTHDGAGLSRPGPLGGDKRFYRGKPVLLLVRDPRDVLVSHYYQATRRKRHRRVAGDLDTFIRGPLGIDRVIAFMNGWAAHRAVPERFLVLRYEDLHADRGRELRRCVEFFGLPGVGEGTLAAAVAAGGFEQMRAMEADNVLDDQRLQSRDPTDPNTYKVRRGKVGGYVEDLTDAQIAFLDDRIRTRLHPMFSYYVR